MRNTNLEIKIREMNKINQNRTAAFVKVLKSIRSCENEEQLETCANMIENYRKLFMKDGAESNLIFMGDIKMFEDQCEIVRAHKFKTISEKE